MEKLLQIRSLLLRSRRLPWLIGGLTLAVLAGVIALTTQQTRGRIREQIAGRDGAILHAVALMHLKQEAADADLLGSPEDPGNLLTVALEASRLKGVIGVRLFDAQGRFMEPFPADLKEGRLTQLDLESLEQLRPISHFRPSSALSELFLETTGRASPTVPVLEVNVPLHLKPEGPLLGIVQFLTKGDSVLVEFARLDRNLFAQGLVTFLVAGFILVAAIAWAFRRLQHAHRLLSERTSRLVEANQELALAARTSAVGAVASHLIHGLRNPLAGLQTFVSSLGSPGSEQSGADLEQAVASTRRMQMMINEVIAVLRDEDGAVRYEMSLAELAAAVGAKSRALCRERGVELLTRVETRADLPHRAANLSALILANLVENAIEATPRAGCVTLLLTGDDHGLVCEVRDEGPGFPAGRNVFAPGLSVKEGGSGIGLAICKQLANHLGAGLDLKSTTPRGCVFTLTLPASLWRNTTTTSVTVTLK